MPTCKWKQCVRRSRPICTSFVGADFYQNASSPEGIRAPDYFVAYRYHLHPSHSLVVIRGKGAKWTGEDILESADEVVSDEQFAPGYDWIYDMRYVHHTVIDVEEMERIVDTFRVFREREQVDPDSNSVIVGSDDDLHFTGTLYQYKSNRTERQFQIVDTMEEALRWLGVEAPVAEILEV